jgi:predicted ArsR family transcriptional regulator
MNRQQALEFLKDNTEPLTSAQVAAALGCSERQARAALAWLRLGRWVDAEPGPRVRDRAGRRYRQLVYQWSGRALEVIALPRDPYDRRARLERASMGMQ